MSNNSYYPIFENYEGFIKENADDMSTPRGAMKMLTDEGMYTAYRDSLSEGITDPHTRAVVQSVMDRQREELLQESANVGASSFASGWTVLSFPILVDIYAEPIVAELMNVYPVDKPVISIPRVRIKSSTRSYDGSSTEESYIPTATKLIRSNLVTASVAPNTSTNVFATVGLSPENLKMNRRYTLLTQVNITETDAGSGTHNHVIDVNYRPDNRNQIARDFEFTDSTGELVEGRINAHVDYEKGVIQFSCLTEGGAAGSSFVCDHAVFTLRFVPVATMNGRTKVSIEMEMNDITIDPNEDQENNL